MRCRRNRQAIAIAAASCLSASPAVIAGEGHAIDPVPLRTVLHDDVRVLWLGDSYSIPYADRPSAASLLSWRIDRWTAFQTGDGPSWFCARFEELATGITTISGSNAYRLHPVVPGSDPRFGLPLWRLREYLPDPSAPGSIDLMQYRMRPYVVASGFPGRFVFPGQTASVRPLFVDATGTDAAVASVTLSGGAQGTVEFDPRRQARPSRVDGLDPETATPAPPADGHIFAAPADYPLVADSASELIFRTAVKPDPNAPVNTVNPAGFVTYRTLDDQREPGLYFSALADGSWSYSGFGSDVPSGTPGFPSKVFSRAQLAYWLDATTLDPEQPLVVFYLLAVEDIEPAEATLAMQNMIDQTAGAAQDAGLGTIHHCLVIPWLHRVDGQDNPTRFPEQRDAAFAIAGARDDVSAISIFDATDQQMFDGNPTSKAWLAANGYDDFRYGSYTADLSTDGGGANGGLLDVFRSHPGSRDAGAFFAHIIEKTIVDACPADFAPPYGVLDLADIGGFITRFVDQEPSADLAAPRGVLDLADVTVFVQSFSSGCAAGG